MIIINNIDDYRCLGKILLISDADKHLNICAGCKQFQIESN